MSILRDLSFLKSVKGKIFLGFFVASIALGASWIITKLAFQQVLGKVEMISTPNDKLRLVNKIFKNILQLDHLQRVRKVNDEEHTVAVMAKSAELSATLDSLSEMSLDDPYQIIRIDSMKNILKASQYQDIRR
jgi:hypothetical protein